MTLSVGGGLKREAVLFDAKRRAAESILDNLYQQSQVSIVIQMTGAVDFFGVIGSFASKSLLTTSSAHGQSFALVVATGTRHQFLGTILWLRAG